MIKGLIALGNVLPYVGRVYNLFTDYWVDQQLKIIKGRKISIKEKRKQLMQTIKGAKTNEERKILSSVLHDYRNNKLPRTE